MGFAVVHMMKIKASGVRGIQSHNNREHTPRNNPDISPERTKENYHLVSQSNYLKAIKKEIAEQATETKTVRKDAVVLCNFIITSDEKTMKALSPEQQQQFFRETVEWFSARYGHVVNATIHMDETTPHMHLGIVPIKENRLSAKTLFTRKELTALQTDFAKEVGSNFGLERGQEGSERKHLSEIRYKAAQEEGRASLAKEHLQETSQLLLQGNSILERQRARQRALKTEIDALQGQTEGLRQEAAALQAEINAMKEQTLPLYSKICEMDEELNHMTYQKQVLEKAIEEGIRRSQTQAGTMEDWKSRIARAKEQVNANEKVRLMEKFISHPNIRPTFEQFCQQMQHHNHSRDFEIDR